MATLILPFLVVYTAGQHTTTPAPDNEYIGSYKTCSSNNECQFDTFECSSTTCSLTCSGYSSCRGLKLMAKMTKTITINCEQDNACNDMVIHAENSGSLTFNSINYESDEVTIYANDSSTLNLNCKGKYSCQNFYVISSGTVNLDAAYDYAFYQSTLNISQSNYISITCSSEWGDDACYSSNWYFPNNGYSTYIYCYGYGCNNFGHIYVDNSIQYLSVNINGCNGECSSISACISMWTIHCANTISSLDYHDSETFYGDSCSSYSTNDCNCDSIISGVSFSDYSASECVSNNEETISSSSSSSIAGIIGSMAGIFICVFIVLVIVCVIIRAQKRGRYNYTAPVRGIQPAKHVPAAPVQQPMQIQQPQVVYMQQMPQQQGGQNMQPRIVYVQAAPQNVQGVPQNVNVVTPMQPQQYTTNNNISVAPGYNNTSVPSAPSAPVYNANVNAPPVYNDAPPAYNDLAPGNNDNGEGGVTNY